MKQTKLITIALLAILLSACANTGRYTGSNYGGNEVRRVERIRMGTVTALAPVQIDARNDNSFAEVAGVITGAVLGHALIGQGAGKVVGTIAGGAVGGALAGAASKAANDFNGIRISLKLDNGELVAITQELDQAAQALRVGDKVQLFNSANGSVRVAR